MKSKCTVIKLNDDGSIDQNKITNLPYLFKKMEKLHTIRNGSVKFRQDPFPQVLANKHVVPLLVCEFGEALRQLPIIFSLGDTAWPLALMGVTQNVNVFIDDNGFYNEPVYIPSYARLYPFIGLPDQADPYLGTVCFDPSCPTIGESVEGLPLFEDGQPTVYHDVIAAKCQKHQEGDLQTAEFVALLQKHDLLEEVVIHMKDGNGDFVSGFQIVVEEKLLALSGDVLRAFNRRGFLGPIFVHLMSLQLIQDIYERQVKTGRYPSVAATVGGGQSDVA